MQFSRIFIIRPVATVLLMVAIAITGFVAYRLLPVAALPQVDYPTVVVSTFYPGASPEVVTSSITSPLERQFGQMPGLAQMTSSSTEGCSVVTLRFVLELQIDVAAQQVQAAINVANAFLPRDLPNPPVYTKTNPADSPVLTLALSSPTIPLPRIQDLADTRLAQKLSQVDGVGQVSITGGQKPAIRIQVNPSALASIGITMADVRTALVAANVNQAKGTFDGPKQSVIITANDQVLTSQQYKELIIAQRNGLAIRLSEVADILDDVENERQAAWVNGTPSILVNIQRQSNANVIEVVDRIRRLIPQIEEGLPSAIQLQVVADRTETIRASIDDVQIELLMTIVLVVVVIFLFLRSPRATFIPGVAVPLSIVGTFGVMYLLGYSVNNLTLMALTISAGFVVDDAIVMLENITRYIEQGIAPEEAATRGAREIGFTIFSLSISLIAVLIPLLFMGDILGRLFREFAVTLSVTILISAFVSLTLTPMMCAKLLKSQPQKTPRANLSIEDSSVTAQEPVEKSDRENGNLTASDLRTDDKGEKTTDALYKAIHAEHSGPIFRALTRSYALTLRIVLRHRSVTMLIFFLTLFTTIWLYVRVPKGFFPTEDTGLLIGLTNASQDVSFAKMKELQQLVNAVVQVDDDVKAVASFIGIDGTNLTVNSGRIQVTLKPHGIRKSNATQIARRIQDASRAVAGITLYMLPVQDLSVETKLSRTKYQYTLEDANANELATWVPKFVEALDNEAVFRDVATDQMLDGQQSQITVDRDTASRLGIQQMAIDDVLYDAFGQRQVSIMFTQSNQYRVILEVMPQFRDSPNDIQSLRVRTNTGTVTPLAAFTDVIVTSMPLAINRQGQFPVVTISFNLAEGASLSDAVKVLERTATNLNMPESIVRSFQGTALAFQNSLSTTPLLLLAALVTVYIVLGVLYESYIHPLTILSTLPSAGIGAILALDLWGLDLTVIALIGIILLIGIVKKNAIMMIDFALDAQRTKNMKAEAAIYEACLLRFRPIMMTTMAALLGAVPLAFGAGVGSELRQPLGITIIGGLLLSQVLTLYTTPVIYLAFEGWRKNEHR